MGGKEKRIEISMIEFSWIFRPSQCYKFFEILESSESDDIFAVEPIKDSIMFLWDFYFRAILLKVSLPYFISFVIFFVYTSFVFKGREHDGTLTENIILAVINILYSFYALYKEVR